MQIADANFLLRYIIDDDVKQSKIARDTLDANTVAIPVEVVFEVVYVLASVYAVPREQISRHLIDLVESVSPLVEQCESVMTALGYYARTKLDFVDCMLAAYSTTQNATIHTFDKRLKKFIESRKNSYTA
jgi:predicted nucleic-acid-binding protein